MIFLQIAKPIPFPVFLSDEENRSKSVGNIYSGIPPELD